MKVKKMDDIYLVRIDRGEDVIASLNKICSEKGIRLGKIYGIGAADDIVLGVYNVKEKKYYTKRFTGEHEITSLLGNVTQLNNNTCLHIHATIADKDFNTNGGHLESAVVSGTCEIFIEKVNAYIDKVKDDVTGLNILNIF